MVKKYDEDETFRVLTQTSLDKMDILAKEWINADDEDYDFDAFLAKHGWTWKEWTATGRN